MDTNEKPRIRFESLRISDARRIDVRCVRTGVAVEPDDLWFEFSKPVSLLTDNIAIALSTLCGRAFAAIHFDFAVSHAVLASVKALTLAEVSSAGHVTPVKVPRAGLQLSFSGGFDSLAALCLMPDETNLVSMDFGGRFSRERAYFENFPTVTVSTNLVALGYNKHNWSFMGSGAILVSDHFRAKYLTFGGILEAFAGNLSPNPVAAKNTTPEPFKAAGYANAPYVLGLTEIGTLFVLAEYRPDHIRESLKSVASPGEEKLYRKQVLAQIVGDRLGKSIDLEITPKPPKPDFAFGQSFALDFLSLYVAKHAGQTVASDLVRDIPAEVFALSKKLDLTFFERANPNLYGSFPAELMGGIADRLAWAKMPFYTEKDWAEYAQVRDILKKHYPSIAM
ncbi:hypothetical protein ACX80E_01575 [Arthrobacter sp. TMN-49]